MNEHLIFLKRQGYNRVGDEVEIVDADKGRYYYRDLFGVVRWINKRDQGVIFKVKSGEHSQNTPSTNP